MTEEQMCVMLSRYISMQYPQAIFHFDYGTGTKLSMKQAVAQKNLNPKRGYPDLFIAEPKLDKDGAKWCGLYLELKKDGIKLTKRNGDFTSDHIREQTEMLMELNNRGYYASFAIGFEEAKKIIDDYLKDVKFASPKPKQQELF